MRSRSSWCRCMMASAHRVQSAWYLKGRNREGLWTVRAGRHEKGRRGGVVGGTRPQPVGPGAERNDTDRICVGPPSHLISSHLISSHLITSHPPTYRGASPPSHATSTVRADLAGTQASPRPVPIRSSIPWQTLHRRKCFRNLHRD